MTQLDGELSPPFEIVEPAAWRAPIIFNSPHSGSVYPARIPHRVADRSGSLRRSEDSFMDELIGGLERARLSGGDGSIFRAPMSTSTASPTNSIRGCSQGGCRASPIPARCGSPAVSAPFRAWSATARRSIASGFRSTMRSARIEALYKPYHRALRRLINKAHQAFGTVILVDCHSMPSIGVSRDEPRRPDMVIGDRYGTSCAPLLPDMVEETMARWAIRSAATSPMPAASSPSITAIRPADCTPSSSNSTARSTWTSGGANAAPRFAQVIADFASAGRRAGRGSARRSRPVPGRGGVELSSPSFRGSSAGRARNPDVSVYCDSGSRNARPGMTAEIPKEKRAA